MAGHSKWAQIKRKKAVTDAQKGRIFSKLAKEITVAARGNPDPKTNLRLKSAVEKARTFNMPNDSIERALKRVADRTSGELEELVLEAFGPGGVGIIITAVTDNRNRTIAELKTLLSKNEAHLSGQGSVSWMFKREGAEYAPTMAIPVDGSTREKLHALFELLDEHDDVQNIFSNEE